VEALHRLVLPLKETGTLQTAFRTQQPVAVADLPTGEERHTAFAKALPGIHSAVAVSMLASRGPLGILMLYTEKPRTFNDQDLRRLTGVARLAAAAVERGELGQALRATEARLQEILDGIPALVVSLDLEGRILSFNATAESVTGWRRDEVLGRVFKSRVGQCREGAAGGQVHAAGEVNASKDHAFPHVNHFRFHRQAAGLAP
jgi:PAS domain-containing protein